MSTNYPNSRGVRSRAELLRDDPAGVVSERLQRQVTITNSNTILISLNQDWGAELNINSPSSPTSHYFVTGAEPVVVTEPAIVIQANGGELERGRQ